MTRIVVVDIGGTSIKIGALVDGAAAKAACQIATASLRSAEIVEDLARAIESFCDEIGGPPDGLVATVPGFLDLDFDHVLYTPNIPELHGIALATALAGRLGCPVRLERDSVLLLHGEQSKGAAVGHDDVLGIFFGTGIGAAFLSKQRPFRGGGWALEIGYLPIGSAADAGILEDVCSGRALKALALEFGCAIEDVFVAGVDDPSHARRINAVVEQQAMAIVTAIVMVSPRVVVLGGGVVEMAGYPHDELLLRVRKRLVSPNAVAPEIKWAELGWRSALYGARRLTLDTAAKVSADV